MTFHQLNDHNLLRELQRGSEIAFETLFDQYWDHVYVICLRATANEEEAKEMTQNIFKSVWENRKKLQINTSFKHYLAKAAKYQVYNYYRDRQLHKSHMECFYSDFCGEDNCTENEIYFNELSHKYGILIDSLPYACKTVFKLSQEQHLTHQQISDRLNISIKTVEYHMRNARTFLQSQLQVYRQA